MSNISSINGLDKSFDSVNSESIDETNLSDGNLGMMLVELGCGYMMYIGIVVVTGVINLGNMIIEKIYL